MIKIRDLFITPGTPELCVVTFIDDHGHPHLTYDSDWTSVDPDFVAERWNEFIKYSFPNILFCNTGKSRFCINSQSGLYYLNEDGYSFLIPKNIVENLSFEQIKKACKLKVFW